MKFKWRKWNRAIHRDFGYLFFGMVIIYSVSGIAINHLKDWNPNYEVTTKQMQVEIPERVDKSAIIDMLDNYGEADGYKKHYFPNEDYVKIFLEEGTATVHLVTGQGLIELTKPRPILKEMNYLHYNPVVWWTWFSDIFAGALILIAISGLFILKGRTGITGRGAWLTLLGIIIPIIFLIIFYY
ncbi:MAG: PepSY-associated TM helix domain-containing protein [Bacteroidales bacterium]